MPEILFYHLERQPLERVLPSLLEKTLERGWRAICFVGSQERVEALDTALWTFRDDSFLPHGTVKDGQAEEQPVLLTCDADVPNQAGVCFVVDGGRCDAPDAFERVVYMFDGHDADAVGQARQQWSDAKEKGFPVTYWQQNDQGRWQQKA